MTFLELIKKVLQQSDKALSPSEIWDKAKELSYHNQPPQPKTDIKHPGNDIQLKIKANKFISAMSSILLAEYKI